MIVPSVGRAINIYNNALTTNESVARSKQQREQAAALFPLQNALLQNQVDTLPTQNALADARVEGANINNQRNEIAMLGERERQRLASVSQFYSTTIDPLLKSGRVEDIVPALQQRRANLIQQGVDTAETDEALNLAMSGNYGMLAEKGNGLVEFARQAGLLGGDNTTSRQSDFNKYQSLRKTDPQAAQQFGRGAGFISDPRQKELFKVVENNSGEIVKMFRDGTEEIIKPNQKVKKPDMRRAMTYEKASSIVSGAKEYQVKSAGFAMRLRDSIDSMNSLIESGNVDPGRVALINKALGDGSIANLNLSPEEQQYMVEAKDALFAILRPETGAAITDQEMAQYSKIYLPQPGDSEKTIKTKNRKLENQFNSLRSRSPAIYDASRVIIGEGQSMRDQKQESDIVDWSDL